MVYYIISKNRKFISCSTVSLLDPSYYDVNETKVRLKDLDNIIKGISSDYRKSISKNNIQAPNMREDDLISKLAFSFNIKSDKIDNINKEYDLDNKRPDYDEALSKDVKSK